VAVSALQLLIDFPPALYFIVGAGIAIGPGLLIAATARLKIIP
jgi:hypothetical protein